MLISNSRKIEPVKTSVQLWWYSKEKCIVYNVSHRRVQVWRYLNKNTIYFFKKHYVQLKRKQVLQSTGYAGCKNTCIGHEISLRKISEPLALKALDFTINSTTTRSAVARELRSLRASFQLSHLRAEAPASTHITQTDMCRQTQGLLHNIPHLRAHRNTWVQDIPRTQTCSPSIKMAAAL